jgi:CP family cyanate transporter-like MFS transporter
VPALLMAPVFLLLSPRTRDSRDKLVAGGGSWWPDWKNPLVWLLGFTFASNNSTYFVTSAFIGDYLGSLGKPELLGPALGWLNGSQIFAVAVLLLTANRLQLRAWPFLVFGPIMLAAFVALLVFTASPLAIVAAMAVVGVAAAVTMTAILALPALLAAPADVPRTAAGMFTVSYTCAVIIPTICGGLWDLTGKPWTVFVPVLMCCVALTVLGAIVVRFRPVPEKTPGR